MRKNSIMMVLYEVLCLLVPLIITPYISRTLGAEGVGIYSYTYSIVTYFVILVQLGIKLYGRREIAKVNDNKKEYSKVFFELLYLELAMFAIVSLLYAVFIFWVVRSETYRIALIIQYIEIVVALLDISWLYFGLEKFTAIVIRNIVVRLAEIFLTLTLIHSERDVYSYIVIMAGCNLLGVLSMWLGIRSKIIKVSVSKIDIQRRILPLTRLFIPVLSTTLFSIVDKTIIGLFINTESVGYYENAYKIAKIPVVVITALGNVALPRVTKLIADGKERESRAFIGKSMSLIMGITVAMSFGMFGIANVFIPLYLGDDFTAAIPLFKILSFMIIFIGWGNVLRTQYMLPKGYDTLYTKSVVYAAIINIAMSLVLVKPLGAFGVAIASLATELVICVYSTIKIRKEIDVILLIKNDFGYLFSGVLMAICVMLIGEYLSVRMSYLYTVIVQVFVGAIVYSISTLIMELVNKRYVFIEEVRNIIKRFLSKKRS